MRLNFIWVLLLSLSVSAITAADPMADIRAAETLARSSRMDEAEKAIAKLNKTQPDGAIYAQLLQVRLIAISGKVEQALAQLQKTLPSARIQGQSTAIQLAYADTLRVVKRYDLALEAADRIGRDKQNLEGVRAGELTSDVFFDKGDWNEALKWINSAIHNHSVVVYSGDGKEYLATLQAKKSRIEAMLELMTHGLGFRLYRIGNALRMNREFDRAVATFDKLIALHKKNVGKPSIAISDLDDPKIEDLPIVDVYAAAADVYRADCLIGLEKYTEAMQSLSLIAKDTGHPYRGEALRLMGEAALADKGDVASAEACFTQAISALSDAQAQSMAASRFRVPEVSREKTEPPEAMRKYVGWGSLEWYKPLPEQVINADTCSWYTQYQLMLAQTKRSMCFFLLGKTDAAVKDLDIILQVDPEDKRLTDRNQPSNYLRLRDDYRSGRLFATLPEIAEFKGKAKIMLIEAEVQFESEHWSDAIIAYTRIANDQRIGLSVGAKAYLDYARASAYVFAGDRKKAELFMAGFTGKPATFSKTKTYWRAQYLLANLDAKNDMTILETAYLACPDQDEKLDFAMKLGQLEFTREHHDAAKAWFTTIVTKSPVDDYRHKAADRYLEIITSQTKN